MKVNIFRIGLLFFTFSLFSATVVRAQNATATVSTDEQWHRNRVDNAYMNKQISDAAEQYKEYAPIPRIAFYDIGYPKDAAEFKELNGYGLLLVSALSQDRTELPLKKVYAMVDGRQIELRQIKQVLISVPAEESRTIKTFGSYRMDALYLFPVYLRMRKAELLVDFAANRNGLKLAVFDDDTPEILKDLPKTEPAANKNSDEAINRFMKREYPGYFDIK
ncbi:MAG: hypothetical protein JSS81_03430 [Acidobacteria bacterium]|nr:hypothetical protein [Acidobacteriota bacterium]